MIDSNNTKYQYIRFKDGKEIFAMVSESEFDNKLQLHLPMNILTKASELGSGIVMHLGPMIPFTLDDTVVVELDTIQARSSISDQYISFYDEACTAWLDLRESDQLEVRSTSEEIKKRQETVKQLIEDRLQREFENIFDEYEEFEDERFTLPNKKDTIH
tara:strand:+ start:752 stop:1228 length:477 start_codon:yes stop_codon:yes gene_type:complete